VEQFAMIRHPLVLLPVLGVALFALAGALHPGTQKIQPFLMVDSGKPSDPKAVELLDRAIAALSPDNVRWLECKVWQQGICEDFSYQGCGRLLLAPDHRARFDMNVKVGKTLGQLRLVSDGKIVYQSLGMGADKPIVSHQDLPSNKAKESQPLAAARSRFLLDRGVAGPVSVLVHMRQCLKTSAFVRSQWSSYDVYVIAASLCEEPIFDCPGIGVVAPRFRPRQVVLYLDAQSLWPHRMEWWGAEKVSQPSRIILQTEFRDPALNQPLSTDRCAAEFAAIKS
jgi:hypothetical protein